MEWQALRGKAVQSAKWHDAILPAVLFVALPLHAENHPHVDLPTRVASSKNAPSMQETVQFIEDHITYSKYVYRIDMKNIWLQGIMFMERASYDACTITIVGKTYSVNSHTSKGNNLSTEFTWKIDISSIDPARVNVSEHWWPIGYSRGDPEILRSSGTSGPGIDLTARNNSWTLPFQDPEMAERMQKAFRHAAQLCGAKAEPF